MGLNRHELFTKLLEQIHFPEKDTAAFQNAAIQSVVVHKNSRVWEFHLLFRQALPFSLFQEFTAALERVQGHRGGQGQDQQPDDGPGPATDR